MLNTQRVIVKGEGYSLRKVQTLETEEWQKNKAELAKKGFKIVQPLILGRSVKKALVYDTSKKRLINLLDGYTKLNVWVVNGKVLGMIMTLSDKEIISDRGYNTPVI